MRQILQLGGPFMWPILLCNVVMWAVVLERAWVVLVRHRLLGHRLTEAELHAHRWTLPFFQDVPLRMGLLGTMLSLMVHLATEIPVGPAAPVAPGAGAQAAAGALGAACLCTIAGLFVSLPASGFVYLLDAVVGPAPAESSLRARPGASPRRHGEPAGLDHQTVGDICAALHRMAMLAMPRSAPWMSRDEAA